MVAAIADFDVAAILVGVDCRREAALVVADHNCLFVGVRAVVGRNVVIAQEVACMVREVGRDTLAEMADVGAAEAEVAEVEQTHISNCFGEPEHVGCVHLRTVAEEGMPAQRCHLLMALRAKEVMAAQEGPYSFCSAARDVLVEIVHHMVWGEVEEAAFHCQMLLEPAKVLSCPEEVVGLEEVLIAA